MVLRPNLGCPFRAATRVGGDMPRGKPPQVPKRGGGTQERDRNKDGRWREKRDDAGKKKGSK